MVSDDLNVDSVRNDLALSFVSMELLLCVLGEPELSAHSNLLSAWELEHGSSQGFLGVFNVGGGSSDGNDDITNVDSG